MLPKRQIIQAYGGPAMITILSLLLAAIAAPAIGIIIILFYWIEYLIHGD